MWAGLGALGSLAFLADARQSIANEHIDDECSGVLGRDENGASRPFPNFCLSAPSKAIPKLKTGGSARFGPETLDQLRVEEARSLKQEPRPEL